MENLKEIVARVFNIEIDKVNDELSADNIENWDSFNHILLIIEIEKVKGIKFSLSEVEKARTFRSLREIVLRKEQGGNNN